MSSDPLKALDPRQRKYLENRAKGLNKTNAALKAGYSPDMARNAAVKIEKPEVKDAFAKLIRQYVPAHRIAKRIQEGLDACETKFFQKDGVVTDSKDVIAWSERREYAKLAAEFGNYRESDDAAKVAVGIKVVIEQVGAGTTSQITAQAG
jgi:phage terminase small subunit